MQIIERLERLSIAKEEYYIMKALILANSDVRMDEFASLKKFRDSILSALSDCVAVIRWVSLGHFVYMDICPLSDLPDCYSPEVQENSSKRIINAFILCVLLWRLNLRSIFILLWFEVCHLPCHASSLHIQVWKLMVKFCWCLIVQCHRSV